MVQQDNYKKGGWGEESMTIERNYFPLIHLELCLLALKKVERQTVEQASSCESLDTPSAAAGNNPSASDTKKERHVDLHWSPQQQGGSQT
jgi:hypothetical protein